MREEEEENMVGRVSSKEHLDLPFVGEFSLGPRYVCKICVEELVTEKSERTRWQEWWLTTDGMIHHKNWCNLKEEGNI